MIFSALAVLCLLAPVQAATLLERYQEFVPLHLKAEIPMPTEVCKKMRAWGKEECHYESKLEISPSFEQLLADTEKSHDTTDAKFLGTPLGKHYQGAKRFVDIHREFTECQASAGWGTKGRLSETLSGLSANASQNYLDENCEDCNANACYEAGVLPSEFLNFASDLENAVGGQLNLESALHLEMLKGSLEARIAYAQRFKGEDVQKNSFKRQLLGELCRKDSKNFCNGGERAILERLIDEQIAQAKSRQRVSAQQVAQELNAKIAQMNETLAQYHKQKKQLAQQWKKEDETNPPGGHLGPDSKDRRKARRDKALLEIKREIFKSYREQYAQLHAGEVGSLLQTEAVKKASKFNELEKQAGKLLGFLGLEEKVLRETQDFPLLTPLDAKVAGQAMDEGISRTNTQVRELLERKRSREDEEKNYLAKIKSSKIIPGLPGDPGQIYREQLRQARQKSLRHLVSVDLGTAGKVLFANPQYINSFCQVAQNLSEAELKRMLLETGGYIGLAAGIVTAAIASAGGSIPFTAFAGIAVAGGVADYSYQKSEARRKRRQQEAMLNSYLAKVEDGQNIEQIRGKWIEALEAERYGLLGLGLIGADFVGMGPLSRGARGVRNIAKLAKGLKGFNPRLARNDQLLKLIAGDKDLSDGFEVMMRLYSREDAGRLLDDISKLSPDKQREAIEFFAQNERKLGIEFTGNRSLASRGDQASEVLGREITDQQALAVQRAHEVGSGAGQLGRDGKNPPGLFNYTDEQLREKAKILKEAGFSQGERRALVEKGIVGRRTEQNSFDDMMRLAKNAPEGEARDRILYRVSWYDNNSTEDIIKLSERASDLKYKDWILGQGAYSAKSFEDVMKLLTKIKSRETSTL